MSAFLQSDKFRWLAVRLLAGTGLTVALIAFLVLIGRPCRFAAVYQGLIWGGGLGPALSAALFCHFRYHAWPRTIRRLVLVAVVALFAMLVVVPNTTGAIQRGREVKAMAEMRQLGHAIESGRQPQVSRDPWGNSYVISGTGDSYTIVSYGECGEPDFPSGHAYPEGPISSPECDLVYSDGHFVRYPEGKGP